MHCNTCDEDKPITCFGKNRTTFCKDCANRYAKAYREKHHDELLRKNKEWYSQYGKDWNKTYKQNNKEEIRNNEYVRYHSDNDYRMRKVLRTRLYKTIKGDKTSKSMITYIGITIEEFRKWIEYQLTEEFSWDNYGSQWEIDHVYPCSSFDLTIEANKRICFNWKNMRPLSKRANSVKTNKILDEDIAEHNAIVQQYINLNPQYQVT